MILYYFAFASLIISVLCQTPPGQPEITAPQTIILGNSYSLSCSSTGGSPPTTVSFLKDNTVISTTTNSLNSATTTDTYTFTAARADHFEVFECQVDNNVLQNPLSTTVFVTVNFAPQLPTISGPNTLTQGDQGTWICLSTNGYPTPTMTARIGNTQFTTGFTTTSVLTNQAYTVNGTLIWSPTTANNGQSLCCVVSHSVLSTPQTACLTLTVNSPLAINAPVLQYNPTIGTNVVLQCEITAGTATNVKWFKDSSELNIAGNSRLSVGTNTVPSLTITGVVQSDQGGYVCQATDGTATVNTATINVNPQGTPPVVTLPQTVYSQITGNSVTLQCTVSSPNSPLQEVQWRFTNQAGVTIDPIIIPTGTNPKYQGSSTTSPALMINNVQSTDQGSYQCRARNLIGTTLSTQSAALTVTGSLPVVQVPTPTYSVVYGSQVTLACNIVSASPAVSNVYWTKISNGVTSTINNGAAGTQGITPSSPSLTINFATTSDEGKYRCYATNAVGTGQSVTTTQLTVTGEYLSLSATPNSGSADIGESQYIINCQISGTPQASSYYWTKNPTDGSASSRINQGTNTVKYTVAASATNPSLTIKNIVQSDDAKYVCTATNVAGTRSSNSARLLVTGAIPQISATPILQSPTYGTSFIVIQCSISGTPAAQSVGWRKVSLDGQTIVNIDAPNSNGKYSIANSLVAPHLTINNLDFDDDANYQCTATNAVDTGVSNSARVDVTGNRPVASIPQTAYTVVYGNDVTIPCQITGANPSHTIVTWYYAASSNLQFSTINVGDLAQYNGGTFSVPPLTIKAANNNDAGIYRCGATNVVGEGLSSNTQLSVIGGIPQVTVEAQSYDVNIGNSAKLVCNVQANPTHTSVYWQKLDSNNQASTITIDNNKYTGATVNNPSLTINNAQLSDRLNYICFATNNVGTGQSSTTYLNVVGNVPVVNVGSATYSVPWGNEITLVCSITSKLAHTLVTWKKIQNGVETVIDANMIASNPNKYEGGVLGSPSLKIKQANRNTDQAFYECSATNSIGTGTSSRTFLSVTGTPLAINAPVLQYNPTIGTNVEVRCLITAGTATGVTWLKDNGQLSIAVNSRLSGGTTTVPSLTIAGVVQVDQGSYVCQATDGTATVNTATINVNPQAEEESNNMEYIIAGVVTAVVVIVAFVIVSVVCYRRGQNSGNNNIRKNESNTFRLQQRGGMLQYANSDVSRMNSQHRHYYGLEPGTTDYHPYNPTPSSKETSQYITPVNDENEHYMTLPGDSTTPYYSEAMY